MPPSSPLALVSLNIEGSKHLDRILPFLASRRPDVFCVQELFESDIPTFQAALGAESLFVPLTRYVREGRPSEPWGIGLFTALPIKSHAVAYYRGAAEVLPDYAFATPATINRAVLSATVEKDGVPFVIANTHFTWTPDGEIDDAQREDLPKFLDILASLGEFALVGDLNAPRGREAFDRIAARYQDNIPSEYTTSIDASLHRKGALPYMVDCLFTTPQYAARDVKLVDRVSDHCAVSAEIEKV